MIVSYLWFYGRICVRFHDPTLTNQRFKEIFIIAQQNRQLYKYSKQESIFKLIHMPNLRAKVRWLEMDSNELMK